MTKARGSAPDLEAAAAKGEATVEDRIESMRRRLAQVQDVVAELASVGEIDVHENQSGSLDLVEVVKTAIRSLEARAQRAGFEIVLDVKTERTPARAAPRSTQLLARELVAHAIDATPRGRIVRVVVGLGGAGEDPALGPRIVIEDSGTSLPQQARRGLLALEVEPGTYGRPSAIPLYVASEIAASQGGVLELGDCADGTTGGVRAYVTFPR
jgi:signal transduction histidine kinase